MNPNLLGKHVEQNVENDDVKRQIKIPKTVNSEYMLNKKIIELMERNVRYVICKRNIFYRK